MSQVIKNPSPKSRFQENPQNVTKHRELMELPQVQRSLDAAMLQYQAALCNAMPSDINGAAAVGLRILGAQEFLAIFRLISENYVPEGNNTASKANLEHRI